MSDSQQDRNKPRIKRVPCMPFERSYRMYECRSSDGRVSRGVSPKDAYQLWCRGIRWIDFFGAKALHSGAFYG